MRIEGDHVAWTDGFDVVCEFGEAIAFRERRQ
jgi:hypothetical protein